MPSKALLRPVGVVGEASAVRGVTGARLEPAEVLARRDGFAHDWKDDGQVEWLNGARISLVRGRARLAGERLVSVGDATLTARHAVVVATGTNALVPAVLAGVRPWTSREATSAKSVPSRLAIVGGGVVGCEMAAAWSALGSRVTLVSRGPLLDRVPAFAGELVAASLREAGVDVRTGVNVSAAGRADGPVTLTLDDGTSVEADEVLAAVGRTPKTADIGLSAVGLKDGSWLSVDDTMRVTDVAGGWLYACGDVNHLALLTHMGKYQARVCGDAIAARATGRDPAVLDIASRTRVPQVVFTLPEVAAIGLTAEQAAAAGLRVRVVEYEIGDVAGAKLFADGYQGRAQMVVDEDRRVIVGLTLAGPGVGEMIHAATIAVVGEVPLDLLWHAVPAYPTMSEVWLRLLETYGL
jgi:dihydrolipoamide dehydrogenase